MTFIAYWPALHGGFVWDDDAWTTNVTGLLADVTGLHIMWTDFTALQQYYPLAGTTFWIDYHLWGFWTLPYHIENLLLHLTAVWLFWRLLRRLEVPGAWLAAAIFALHPVMVESAGWITERKNVLSMVFFLGGLLAYGRYASFWKEDEPSKKHYYAYGAALLLLAAALLSKTTTFCFPAVTLLICWWKRGGIRWRKDALPTLPFFILAIGLSGLTAWLEKNNVGAKGPDFTIGWAERFIIAGHAFWFYLDKLFWPAHLCPVYARWGINPASVGQWLYPLSAGSLIFGLWYLRKRIGRGPVTAAFFFVGTLFPVLGFMNAYYMRYSFVCDHWVYLSSLGVVALVSAALARVAKQPGQLKIFYALSGGLLLLLAGLTWVKAGDYADMETYWRNTIAKNPDCWLAYNNLGSYQYGKGRTDEAIASLNKCLELKPDLAEAHNNLGSALLQKNRIDEAMAQFQSAVELAPQNANAHNNFGNALLQLGRMDEAMAQFKKALEIASNHIEANNDMGVALMKLGRLDEAKSYFEKSIQLNPNYAEALNNLGRVFEGQGRYGEAEAQYRHAMEIKPDYGDANFSLAKLLAIRHQDSNAIVYYKKTIQLMPDYAEAHNNLANLLVAQKQTDEAVLHYQKAIQINPDYGEAHYNFGVLLSLQGKMKEALEQYEAAVRSMPDSAPAHNRLGLALQMNKNYVGATQQFEAAVKLDPMYLSAANNLAWLLATCADKSLRDGPRAVQLAEKVNRSTPMESAQFLDTLSAAYAEAGQFKDAIATIQRAITLATSRGDASLAATLRLRAGLYEANTAYHELQ